MLRGFFGNLIFAIIARMLCGNHLNLLWAKAPKTTSSDISQSFKNVTNTSSSLQKEQPRKKYLSVSLIIVIKVSIDLAEHNFYSMRRPRIGINNKSSQRLFFREKTKEKSLVAQKRTNKLNRKHIAFKPKPNLVHIGGRNASSLLHNVISCAKTISGIKFYSDWLFQHLWPCPVQISDCYLHAAWWVMLSYFWVCLTA